MIRLVRPLSQAVLAVAIGSLPVLAQNQNPNPTPGAVANSALDGRLMYQLLLGELNAMGGEAGTAYSLLLDAARKTGDARLFKRATDIALQARSGESALQAARAWTEAMPRSREANRYLLQILIGLNRMVEVPGPLRREIDLADEKERATAINGIPRYFARATDKKQAAALVEPIMLERVGDPALGAAAWTTIGRMRTDAADLPGALEAARRGQAVDALAEGPAILAISLMDPKLPAAEAVVRKYLEGQPRVEVRMDYARALLGMQRYADGAAQLAAVTGARPDYAPAWLIKGTLEQQNRQFAQAEQSLRRFVQLEAGKPSNPADAEARRGLTQAYLRLAEIAEHNKDFAAARAWLDRIDDGREALSVQSRRAALLAREGRLDEGRALIRALPAQDPAAARRKLSAEVQLLRENKQYKTAYDLVQEALTRSPLDVDLMYDLAMLAEKLDDLVEMERLLRLAIAAKPDYHHAYNALGYSFADRNIRLPEARQLVLKALEFAPDDPYISDSLAWVEFRSGNFPEALRILQKAFRDKPDAEIAAHLGEVLWVMGEHEKAKEIWREGMQINAENETLLETLKRLRVSL